MLTLYLSATDSALASPITSPDYPSSSCSNISADYDPDVFDPRYWHETKGNFFAHNREDQQQMLITAAEHKDWNFVIEHYTNMIDETALEVIPHLIASNETKGLIDCLLLQSQNWSLREKFFEETTLRTQRKMLKEANEAKNIGDPTFSEEFFLAQTKRPRD